MQEQSIQSEAKINDLQQTIDVMQQQSIESEAKINDF